MKPFVFRLEAVLSIWQRRDEAALLILQREQAKTAAARQRTIAIERQRLDAQTALRAESSRAEADHDPAWHRNWITHITMTLDLARRDAARCAAEEEAARRHWQQARRDRRVIERLRERALRRYAHDARRDEMKVMDELAVQGAFRKEGLTW